MRRLDPRIRAGPRRYTLLAAPARKGVALVVPCGNHATVYLKLAMEAPVRPKHHAARPRPARALASLLLAAQLGAALHFVVVRHDVCPIHGELMEADAPHGHTHALAAFERDRLPRIAGVDAREALEGHEHCALTALRRQRASLAASAAQTISPARTPVGTLALDDTPRPWRVAVHRLAPKHSPPA